MSKIQLLVVLLLLSYGVRSQTNSNLGQLVQKGQYTPTSNLSKFTFSFSDKDGGKLDVNEEIKSWFSAVKFLQSHPDEIKKDLTITASVTLFKPDLTSDDDEISAFSYVLLAIGDEKNLKSYFSKAELSVEPQKSQMQDYISRIKVLVGNLPITRISVFASGDVLGTIGNSSTGGSGGSSTIASGSLGIRLIKPNNILTAKVSVVSTGDTITSNLGQSILSPAKGKGGSMLIEWFHGWNKNESYIPWLHLYLSTANSVWSIPSSPDNLYRTASIMGVGALANWTLINKQLAETPIGLNVEFGPSFRYLGGDIRTLVKNGGQDSTDFRKSFPTKKNNFLGLEGGLNLSVGDVTASFQSFYYFPRKNESIIGLTGLQFTFGISVSASVISGIVN